MRKMTITKEMQNGFEKAAGYQENYIPPCYMQVVELEGDLFSLQVNRFHESGDTGCLYFSVMAGDRIIADGDARFKLHKKHINAIHTKLVSTFNGFGTVVVNAFVMKAIYSFNEYNYSEFVDAMERKSEYQKSRKKYMVAADAEAVEPSFGCLLQKLKEDTSEIKRTEIVKKGELKGERAYIRKTDGWYVQGHYRRCRNGRVVYIAGHFHSAKVAVGKDYRDFRVNM